MRSGYAALIGRPNAGKSTLLNRLLGEKVAIVSPKPQTTRTRILGVLTKEAGQIAFFDTPGIHNAKGALNKFMVDAALHAAEDCDVVLFLVDVEGAPDEDKAPTVSPGNRQVLERLKTLGKPVILVLTKIDLIKKHLLLPFIDLYRKEFPFAEVIPVSARQKEGLEVLFERVLAQLPEGEPIFPADMLTDQAEKVLVAELIREQVLRHCHQEVPYSVAVVVEEFDESERDKPPPQRKPPPKKKGKAQPPPAQKGPKLEGLVRIAANVFVERDSQKAIVIGKRGEMLKTIGTDARQSIQRMLGNHVYLALNVKVEPRWTERPDGLRKLGYSPEEQS